MIRCQEIHLSTWNELMETTIAEKYTVINRKYNKNTCYLRGYNCYVWKEKSCAYCYYGDMANGTSHFYKTRLDRNNDMEALVAGGSAAAQLTKRTQMNLVAHKDKAHAPFSVAGLIWFNSALNNKRYENCIGYDRNSAFTWGMMQDMPDTNNKLEPGILEEGQIGFDDNGNMVEVGKFAFFRFPKIPTPFTDFVNYYYKIKQNAKTITEKQRAKKMLNLAVGTLQHHNCFMRAAIIGYSNKFMLDIINRYEDVILFSNTDSIVSMVPIPEIEENISNELGDWKIEHTGTFAYKDTRYQWNDDYTVYRGIPKKWFENYEKNYGKKFDLLTDELPKMGNEYILNVETGVIEA